MWSSIVAAEGALAGYDRGAIVAYFVVQSVVYHFTGAWQVWDFSYLIRTGRLSARLVKPFDPSHHLVASNVAFKLMNLVWLIPIWTGMYLYFRPELPLGVGSVLTFLLALLLASVLLFLWNQCFAMIAFWTVRASAFYEFADALGYMVGGGIAPVALIPPALQSHQPRPPVLLRSRLSHRSGHRGAGRGGGPGGALGQRAVDRGAVCHLPASLAVGVEAVLGGGRVTAGRGWKREGVLAAPGRVFQDFFSR